MKLKGTPERAVSSKITRDIYTDTVSLSEPDNLGHPHRSLQCVWEAPLDQFLKMPARPGVFYQDHRSGRVTQFAEGDLAVDEVEAVLHAVDGVVVQDEEAGVTAL